MARTKRTKKRCEIVKTRQLRQPPDTTWGCASKTFYERPKCPPNRPGTKDIPDYTGLFGKNPKKGTFWKPNPRQRGHLRPGTQAIREIRKYQRTTNLCISKLPFMWFIKEITWREYFRRHPDKEHPVEAPDISNKKLNSGEKNQCPLRWQANAIDALHEGAKNYLIGLLEDANLLALHARRITVQPRDIQLAKRIRGDVEWWRTEYRPQESS